MENLIDYGLVLIVFTRFLVFFRVFVPLSAFVFIYYYLYMKCRSKRRLPHLMSLCLFNE